MEADVQGLTADSILSPSIFQKGEVAKSVEAAKTVEMHMTAASSCTKSFLVW